MVAKFLCKLGFHDWYPIEEPRVVGYSSEAACECFRCSARSQIVMMFTDQLQRRWDVVEWDRCNSLNYEYCKSRGELPSDGTPIPEGDPLF